MKPYQIYEVRRFPKLTTGKKSKTEQQLTLWGETEEIVTEVELVKRNFAAGFDLLKIVSKIPVRQYGYIRFPGANGHLVKQEFAEYIKPVEFEAYYHEPEQLLLFQAPKSVCSGVHKNITAKGGDLVLGSRRVDFAKIHLYVDQFSGGWFHDVSPNVTAEGFSGSNVQNDPRFKECLQTAKLSNLTIPFEYAGARHEVMLTRSSAVVLRNNYSAQSLELEIVLAVKRTLLERIWAQEPEEETPPSLQRKRRTRKVG